MQLYLWLMISILSEHLGCTASLQGSSRQQLWAESVVLVLVLACAALITGMAVKTALHYSYRKRLPGIELEGLRPASHELEVLHKKSGVRDPSVCR